VAAPGLKPVGVSTDPVQAQPLPKVQIPALPLDKSKPQDRSRRDERQPEGWGQQETIVQAQVELRHERSAAWRRFQSGSGRRSNFGAVLIDGPKQPRTLAPTTAAAPQDGNGWVRIDRMHGHAAQFEEKNRPNLDQLGADASLDFDPSSPVSRAGGAGNKKRRRYTIA
jgi:hypothetical protein